MIELFMFAKANMNIENGIKKDNNKSTQTRCKKSKQ